MVIMAMATVRNIHNFRTANVLTVISWLAISTPAIAGEWRFVPHVGIEETYTDNVELTTVDTVSSLVSQAIIDLNAEYYSHLASFSLSGKNNNLFFSHDSDINDSYLTLDAQGQLRLGTSGVELIASAKVDNTNRNSANNGLADLVSGDTVQSESYSTGLRYTIDNSDFSLNSSLTYNIQQFEDGIGEYNGISAAINARNNNNARLTFWQLTSSFSTRDQDYAGETRTADQYNIEAKLGLVTSLNLNPFIRFYDEDFSGDLPNQNQQTTASWGPGVRWLISDHLTIDFSYNIVDDDTVSEDYVATSIQWEPSARTSLFASYSKRFFGDSYNLNLQHQTKRLINTITYNESLQVFDRNNFEQINVGFFWCPQNIDPSNTLQCFAQAEQPASGDFRLVNFSYLEPVEGNEFSLNKSLSWASTLQLARTSFSFNTSATRLERIESQIINDTLGISFAIKRKISGKSSLTFSTKYDYRIFDKNNPEGSRQEDYYRTISATYTKDLASSLSSTFTIQHINRDSNLEQYTYNEARVIINVTKEF